MREESCGEESVGDGEQECANADTEPASESIREGSTEQRGEVRRAHHGSVPGACLCFALLLSLGQEEDKQRDERVEAEAL